MVGRKKGFVLLYVLIITGICLVMVLFLTTVLIQEKSNNKAMYNYSLKDEMNIEKSREILLTRFNKITFNKSNLEIEAIIKTEGILVNIPSAYLKYDKNANLLCAMYDKNGLLRKTEYFKYNITNNYVNINFFKYE